MSGINDSNRSKEVTLRAITLQDLPAVAGVHLDSFPKSALSRLGSSIVERYYHWQLEGPHRKVWAVGAFLDGECVGYSFSGDFNGSTSGFLRRNRGYLAGMIMLRPWLLFDPFFFDRFRSGLKLLAFRRNKKAGESASGVEPKPRSYGILSIAVARKYQKFGIGKIMMLDAEREATGCEFTQMHLTVSPENEKAIRFYEGLGWVRKDDNGDWHGLMVKQLAAQGIRSSQTVTTRS